MVEKVVSVELFLGPVEIIKDLTTGPVKKFGLCTGLPKPIGPVGG